VNFIIQVRQVISYCKPRHLTTVVSSDHAKQATYPFLVLSQVEPAAPSETHPWWHSQLRLVNVTHVARVAKCGGFLRSGAYAKSIE
jgi:hypothetical protein